MNPLVSIIIPTYNEEKDIERTLTAVLNLDHDRKEIILVDDASTDKTPQILDNYAREGRIIFLRQDKNKGVASARNRGIKAAKGEIVIILNADVVLNKDFINRILPHYEKGADFVVCQSRIKNTDKLIPAFLDAQDHMWYDHRDDLIWSEGFSCRKQALLDAGLFDEKFPGCSGEDAALGEELDRRYKRVFDRSIIVPHIAPHTLKVFWRQRMGRGRGTPYKLFYTDKIPFNVLLPFLIGVTTITLFQIILLFPLFKTVFKLYGFSRKGLWIIPFFFIAETVDRIAQRKGEWKAYIEIKKREDYVERG